MDTLTNKQKAKGSPKDVSFLHAVLVPCTICHHMHWLTCLLMVRVRRKWVYNGEGKISLTTADWGTGSAACRTESANYRNHICRHRTDKMGEVDEDVQEVRQKKANRHDGGVADLERVTDYAEEREIQFNMTNVSGPEILCPEDALRPSAHFRQQICLVRNTPKQQRSG